MDKNLVKRAKSGDINAFARLYEKIYSDLYKFALYTLRNPEDAQDAVSDAVVCVYASIHKLRNEDAFKAWMFKILSNICCRKIREYSKKTVNYDEITDSLSNVSSCDENVILRQLFFELSEEERMIIALHVFGGYTSKEIAKALKMNENTVRSKESRGLKKLADKLASE